MFVSKAFALMTLFSVSCLHPPSDDLYVLPRSFKSQTNHVLYGQLTACQRAVPADDLRFAVMPLNGVNVTLLDDTVGDFMFTPEHDFEGIVTFWYLAWDAEGTSDLSTVTISVKRAPTPPSLNVSHLVVGLENTDIALDIAVDSHRDHPYYHALSVSICDCGHNVTCNRESDDHCHCHLSLPHGWDIFSRDQHDHRLSNAELNYLDLATASNLVLRASAPSSAEHCLDVHVVTLDLRNDHSHNPSIVSKNITIHIYPFRSTIILNSHSHEAHHFDLTANTTQGRPYRFSDLMMVDSDGVHGKYALTVQLDHGGLLWVRQENHDAVDFFPRTGDIHPEQASAQKAYRLLDRFGTFKSRHRPLRLEEKNNGVKILRLIGSLEDINEVLETLTFVPWCADWPTPPSWPVPEDSWMGVSSDHAPHPHHPNIWPQWYPRFWYPFDSYPWSWWPRVLPPWWMTSACSDWTSTIHVRVKELDTSPTCHQHAPPKETTQWATKIEVSTTNRTPKSLVTSNHFSYFEPHSGSVHIHTVYMRSLDYDLRGNVTFNLTVLESNHARAEFSSTGHDHATCSSVEECNNHLMDIGVDFLHGADEGVCHITVQIDLHKENVTRLGDRLVVWAVNTTRECLDVHAIHPDFELTAPHPVISMRQGSHDNPLHLTSNVPDGTHIEEGIIHAKVFAEHGVVTMRVPDGLRLYSDHMAQHEGIPTYQSIAGPAAMVMDALATARLTPFKNLIGDTHVTVDYMMPSTASKLLYGQVRPFHRLQVTIHITDIVLSPPVVIHPPEVCVAEPDDLPINMINVRTFGNHERMTFTVHSERGTLRVNTSDKGLYECPDIDPLSQNLCVEMCSGHLDCSGTQLCCFNGCGHNCVGGELRAGVHVTHSGEVVMNGSAHDINQNILRNVVLYIPEHCHSGESAYTDTLTIRINPASPPEHDLARETIPVHVTCSSGHQDIPSEEECGWGDWSSCHTEEHACGTGHQERHRTCSSNEYTESRPCLNCTCLPVEVTVSDPYPSMKGCSTNAPVLQCSHGCSVSSLHTETVSFQCSHSPDELTQHELIIHDACICEACTFGRKHY